MNNVITLNSPLFIDIPRKTKPPRRYILNKNNERNWHFQVNNKIKQLYKEQVHKQLDDMGLQGFQFTKPIEVGMIYYKENNRKVDKSNVDAIHRKFMYDALVHYGREEEHIPTGTFTDKGKERVTINVIRHGLLADDNDDYIKKEIIHPTVYNKEEPCFKFYFKEVGDV